MRKETENKLLKEVQRREADWDEHYLQLPDMAGDGSYERGQRDAYKDVYNLIKNLQKEEIWEKRKKKKLSP